MSRIERLLMAAAVAAVAVAPAFAQSPSQPSEAKKEAKVEQAATQPQQGQPASAQQSASGTGSKMTREEKKPDKAFVRRPPTREEQEHDKYAYAAG